MFTQLFTEAAYHATTAGGCPQVYAGQKLHEMEIRKLEERFGFTIPTELRNFYHEMGCSFRFSPASGHSGFSISHISDLKFSGAFHAAVEEELALELANSNLIHTRAVLEKEAERRRKYFPFYGIGEGGAVLCLDLARSPAPVCFHDSLCWTRDDARLWTFELSPSFPALVTSWSAYCFSDPKCDIVKFCETRVGEFDWSPEYFEDRFRRDDSSLSTPEPLY